MPLLMNMFMDLANDQREWYCNKSIERTVTAARTRTQNQYPPECSIRAKCAHLERIFLKLILFLCCSPELKSEQAAADQVQQIPETLLFCSRLTIFQLSLPLADVTKCLLCKIIISAVGLFISLSPSVGFYSYVYVPNTAKKRFFHDQLRVSENGEQESLNMLSQQQQQLLKQLCFIQGHSTITCVMSQQVENACML